MKYGVSSGAVVFTRKNNQIYYVIVKLIEGFYGFPKGHIEENETAIREIYEETGLKPNFLEGFRVEDEHLIQNKKDVIKRVIYFFAEYENQEICIEKKFGKICKKDKKVI